MTTLADSLIASSSRPLAVSKRADLEMREQRYHGRLYFVIKDPLSLKYYRFEEEEYALLEMLDGETSADEIVQKFDKRFAPQRITIPELHQFLGSLYRSSLVVSQAPEQGKQLNQRRIESEKRERIGKLTNVLAIRFKGIDPDRLLTSLNNWVGWIFSWPAFCFILLLGLTALSLLAIEFDTFSRKLPTFQQFFASENWLLLACTMGITKILHELGHGVACKRFGGECHEMGVMLLVLTPCLYCNVSDSWMLPSKWRRAMIGAAGMYVELIIASIATLLWWFSKEGTLNYLCLNIMFVCSVSTLLFNANPLLRYDGYYILSDVLEIPNLRQKASTILQRKLGSWFLGLPTQHDPFLPTKRQWLFAIYSVASAIYRWVVALAIFWMLYNVFEPYGFKVIGQMIAMTAIYGLVVAPLWRLGKFFMIPGRFEKVNKLRAAIAMSVACGCLSAALFIPVPHYVRCDFRVEPRDAASVFVDAPGELQTAYVEPGQRVKAGAVIAKLEDVDTKLAIVQLTGEQEELFSRLDSLRRRAFYDEVANGQIAEVEKGLQAVERQLATLRRNEQRLVLRAPREGYVLSPPPQPPQSEDEDVLPTWTGRPLDVQNTGALLAESVLVCRIADPAKLEAVLAIDQADMEFIAENQQVKLYVDNLPHRIYVSQVKDISYEKMKAAPRNLASKSGGLATKNDAAGYVTPLSTTYEVATPLNDTQGELYIGATGKARVRVGSRTVGVKVWRYLCQTFHFDL